MEKSIKDFKVYIHDKEPISSLIFHKEWKEYIRSSKGLTSIEKENYITIFRGAMNGMRLKEGWAEEILNDKVMSKDYREMLVLQYQHEILGRDIRTTRREVNS